jgi:pyrimidine operon attenuation protein / uracil phosphoribosyltransferase
MHNLRYLWPQYFLIILKVLLGEAKLQVVIQRLAHQLLENNSHPSNLALIGLQPRGVPFANRIHAQLSEQLGRHVVSYGKLDITLYRDDHASSDEIKVPAETDINFSIEGKDVVLIDDVLYTGRSIRSALDALIDFGRPNSVQLMVLIDRRFRRELPIQANYVGLSVDTIVGHKVKVQWKETSKQDQVILLDN